ncbi:uncharacterized protein [Miscanthus floridulus]|uniref:uncharacterized protein n=1 Tax=Miscanthus floridulus TaxID=154761 RepID=UPI00345A2056
MEIMAQVVAGFARGGHGGNGGNEGGARRPEGPSSYQDFLKTHPPTFTPLAEPLDVEHWLRILEQKFLLLNMADEQKVSFAVQQLLGEFYIPAGILNRKLTEFLELCQGSMTVMDYVNKFNHLSQYAGIHVDTNEMKDRFFHGLSYILQEKLYTANYQICGALMNAAITMEGLQRDSQAEWKRKRVAIGSSSHPHTQKDNTILELTKESASLDPNSSHL